MPIWRDTQRGGPWGRQSNLIWFYNYATTCPKDDRGRSCNDGFVDEIGRWFGPGGDSSSATPEAWTQNDKLYLALPVRTTVRVRLPYLRTRVLSLGLHVAWL